jgi:AcrR family transcriptional regulator
MGGPREHDDRTARALLAAAERTVEEHGARALSVRAVAGEVGTGTRAVYSVFGSKDGLIAALGARMFEPLRAGLDALPSSADPVADLVEAGLMFRRVAIAHPSLFAIGVQRIASGSSPIVRSAASDALTELRRRVQRLADAGKLGGRNVEDATTQFHALCEGFAALELRGVLAAADAECIWREGLEALAAGFARGNSAG